MKPNLDAISKIAIKSLSFENLYIQDPNVVSLTTLPVSNESKVTLH